MSSANVNTAIHASRFPFQPTYLAIAGVVGISSLLCDAIGQTLKTSMTARQRRAWATANAYHLSHTLALVAVAWMATLAEKNGELDNAVARAYLKKGFYLMLAGALSFGSSIYALALGLPPSAAKIVGPVTPSSGLILVLGWINVGLAGLYW